MNTLGAKLIDFYKCGSIKNAVFRKGSIEMRQMAIDTCVFREVDLSKVANCEFLACSFHKCILSADQARRNRFIVCAFFDMNLGAVASMESCIIMGPGA